MKEIKRAQDLIGNNVYDRHGDKIGRVDNVYIDDTTDQPEWITVRSGLLTARENFVPLAGASQGDGGIRVCVSRSKVRRAPQVNAEDGHLSNKDGRDLYLHYGIQRGSEAARPAGSNQDQTPPSPEEQTLPGGIKLEPPDDPE
jgi:sporulation protein YlmC with PRC-barrel domain